MHETGDLRYLCLLAQSGVQHILCCVFVLFFLVLCTLCCQFLWIVHFWLPLLYSQTFIIYILNLIFIMLAHWKKPPLVKMSFNSDILFWFRVVRLHLNAVCLAEKQQIPNFGFWLPLFGVFTVFFSNSRWFHSTSAQINDPCNVLEACTLTISPPIRLIVLQKYSSCLHTLQHIIRNTDLLI